MRFVRFIVSLLLISQICGVTMAQDSLNVRMFGEVHDFVQQSHDVDISGKYAYVASGLKVVDVSDPTAPVEIAYHRTPGAHAQDITVADNLVYVLEMTHFEIFEIAEVPTGVEVDLLASGIYLVRLDANGVIDSHKLILMK